MAAHATFAEPRLVEADRRDEAKPREGDDEVVLQLVVDRGELVADSVELVPRMDAVALAVALDEPLEATERQTQDPARDALSVVVEAEVVEQPQEQLRV